MEFAKIMRTTIGILPVSGVLTHFKALSGAYLMISFSSDDLMRRLEGMGRALFKSFGGAHNKLNLSIVSEL
jgi:hypothetical protein